MSVYKIPVNFVPQLASAPEGDKIIHGKGYYWKASPSNKLIKELFAFRGSAGKREMIIKDMRKKKS